LESDDDLTIGQALPFQKVQHQVTTTDVQPGMAGGILVMVTGALLVDDQQQPMSYAQTFQLAQGKYFAGDYLSHKD
jgi:hypothetical protein